ncbi:hypothetical protein E8E12_007202 [Didymella heteroderae]|uniref:Uncharacterized protein n=1 Tax=Didymella heteroderae TaxID=1769908 RepID=A0A9P4WNX2_9PLEO|nr:hypothetical protein E8E12_007202 [Didymella heteroderae]
MRRALGGSEATSQLQISTVHRPAPRPGKNRTASDARRSSRSGTKRRPASVSTAITARLEEKEKLQQEQQAPASTQNEDELRERLRTLEEQLAVLQAKLAADNTTRRKKEKEGKSAADVGSGTTKEQPSGASKQDNGSAPADQPEKSDETAETRPKPASASKSSGDPRPQANVPPPSQSAPQASPAADEASAQSLLDELFPEASSLVQPAPSDKRPSPPKLELPAPDINPHIRLTLSDTRTAREKTIDSFRARGEHTTVLQLSNCSTALTESDFRRLIPRGAHIDTWSSAGEFYKIIPGRDPLSLARLPFYYLLFRSPSAAMSYQKNASRLSRRAALHAPSSAASAVAPPAGFLENGEDIAAVSSGFVLHPQGHRLDLRTVMQPYNPALRALIDGGGYTPIVPSVDENGNKIHRVLLAIDGYEPGHWDLWQIIARHAHARGILWPFRNDHASALRRLRDTINLTTVRKQRFQDLAASNPRAAAPAPAPGTSTDDDREFEDPTISAFLGPSSSSSEASSTKEINQLVMNRVYNRWIVEFEDEDAARRFAGLWHRVKLPDAKAKDGKWKEAEEERWVQAEYLW